MKNVNIETLLGNELANTELFYVEQDQLQAWVPGENHGIQYRVESREKDGAWISARFLEEEGGTTWEWSDPMFYPYEG